MKWYKQVQFNLSFEKENCVYIHAKGEWLCQSSLWSGVKGALYILLYCPNPLKWMGITVHLEKYVLCQKNMFSFILQQLNE